MKKIISNNLALFFASFLFSFLLFNVSNNKVYIPQTNFFQEENEPENPNERIKQRVQIRADESGYIPMDGLIKAKEQRDQLLAATMSKSDKKMDQIEDGGIRGWEWLGPGNIGGRIRAILMDRDNPDRIWIGSVSGGIWVTENGGDYWNPVDDFMANLAITSLVMDSKHSDVLYAGTGEYFSADGLPGAGIFKSTDRGRTWNQLSSTNNNNFRYVSRLVCHPNQYDNIFACTWLGLFHSFDAGRTWNKILAVPDVRDIKISKEDPDYILVGTIRDVYLSTDGGINFEKQTTELTDKLPDTTGRCEVAIAPSSKFTMYVSKNINGGEIWRTLNGGSTWKLMNSGTNYLVSGNGNSQGNYDNALWVSPTNMNFIVVGGIDLWRSDTGGKSLEKISDWLQYHIGLSAHADQHIIVEHPMFGLFDIKTVYIGNDGGIQKAENIETVSPSSGWTNLANHLGITQFYGGTATPMYLGDDYSLTGWIFGGTQDNSTLKYTPATGTNWYQAITGDGGFCALDIMTNPLTNINSINILIELPHLDIWKGRQSGLTYLPSHLGIDGVGERKSSLFIAPLVNAPQRKSFYLAGGVNIWISTNDGDFWESIFEHPNSARCSAIDILWDGTSSIYCGFENGDIYKLDNNTSTKVDDGLPDDYITDIAVSNTRGKDWVFVTFGTYNANPNIWFSEDGGQSWKDASGTGEFKLPDIPINSVRFHPVDPYSVYIGTDLGVYASDNLGATWSVYPLATDNEGPANVEVSELFWQDDYLIAATHGRGMFRCRPKTFIYVDKNANSLLSDGSYAFPYTKVKTAVDAAGNGTNIYIIGNTYSEAPITFNRAGTINAVNGTVIIK